MAHLSRFDPSLDGFDGLVRDQCRGRQGRGTLRHGSNWSPPLELELRSCRGMRFEKPKKNYHKTHQNPQRVIMIT